MMTSSSSGQWLRSTMVAEAAQLMMDHKIDELKRELRTFETNKPRWGIGMRAYYYRAMETKHRFLENPQLINSYAVAMKIAVLARAGEAMAPGGKVWITADDFWVIKDFFDLRNERL